MSTISCLSRAAAFGLFLLGAAARAQSPELPTSHQHLGPASCASSACHGRVSPESNANVRLDEYRIWSREDRHARAYQTLLGDASKAIARRLGIGEAHEAQVCLDCHADNVPAVAPRLGWPRTPKPAPRMPTTSTGACIRSRMSASAPSCVSLATTATARSSPATT